MSEINKSDGNKVVSMRIGNLELRSHGCNQRLEIVEWGDSYCWTVALWHADRDGVCSLYFVHDRPSASSVNWDDFRLLAETGQLWLDGKYKHKPLEDECD